MRLALQYEMQRPELDDHLVVKETMEQCVLADQAGFDYVWFVEHHQWSDIFSKFCVFVVFFDKIV